jgi:tetratricopeptide (TPR) repeat protein
MKSKRLTSSFVALVLVAVIALGYAEWARKASAPAPGASASARLAPSAVALASAKDVCAQAADRCACAAEHGAQLLAACFPERAVQLMSLAPASCATAAFLGVHAEALAAIEQGLPATKSATNALQSEPNNRFARRALAVVALQAHDFARSDAALSKLIGEDAKDVDSLYYMALSQRYRDHYNAAREGFLAVLRLDAQHIDARFNLVTLTAKAGADQEADHHYQELLEIAPVGDSRLISARSALRGADKGAAQTLPVMRETSPANAANAANEANVVPSR